MKETPKVLFMREGVNPSSMEGVLDLSDHISALFMFVGHWSGLEVTF